MKDLKAKNLMTTEVITVEENMPLQQLSELLIEKMISGAPVVDDQGQLKGVVSLSDLARHNAQEIAIEGRGNFMVDYYLQGWEDNYWGDKYNQEDFDKLHLEVSDGLAVKDIMTPMVFTAPEDISVQELAKTMSSGRIHRLIITRDDKMVGVVTSMDILRAVSELDS